MMPAIYADSERRKAECSQYEQSEIGIGPDGKENANAKQRTEACHCRHCCPDDIFVFKTMAKIHGKNKATAAEHAAQQAANKAERHHPKTAKVARTRSSKQSVQAVSDYQYAESKHQPVG